MHVTWYGSRFDLPMVNSKLILFGEPPLPHIPHIDGWKISKYKLKIHSNRLASVQEFLGLPTSKTPVKGGEWLKAMAGDRTALKYIVSHCKADVNVLEEAYLKLRPLINNHPRVGDKGTCYNCGSKQLQSRGPYVNRSQTPKVRIQCQGCGTWDTRRINAKGEVIPR